MGNSRLLGVIVIIVLFSSFLTIACANTVKAETFQGWQVEDGGGSYSENDDILSLSGTGGTYVILYQEISPENSFSFSLQVNAITLQGFAIMLRSSLPFAGSTQGIAFEFGAREGGALVFARWTSYWKWDIFATGINTNEWYTLVLSVQKSPFVITATAYDEDGNLVGSYSASDMTNLNFDNIRYIGFGVLESGGSYLVRNIFNIPSGLNVVPETPFGTLAIMATFFAALGLFIAKKRIIQ